MELETLKDLCVLELKDLYSAAGHIKDVGSIRSQFHHVIDIVPTILEAIGIKAPEEVNGIKQKPIEGVSMAYTFDQANAKAPAKGLEGSLDLMMRKSRIGRDRLLTEWTHFCREDG